jgi:REP element-mobilizing transposase RayT
MMAREDVLRALELLPVWQLKTPLATAHAGEVACATNPAIKEEISSNPVAQATPPANTKSTSHTNLQQGIHQRGYLPHLKAYNGIYAVTFRLHDSLPAHFLEQMAGLPVEAKSEEIEINLNKGLGDCWLAKPVVADMLKSVLLQKHQQDYYVHAWVIMPNHVHLLLQPLGDILLSDCLQAIKSISAHHANFLLERSGAFWQRESYDHLVRNEADFNHALEYIAQNPVKANLVKQAADYAYYGAFTEDAAHAGEVACATNPAIKEEISSNPVAQATPPASTSPIQLLLADNTHWLFALPDNLTDAQQSLFNNILQALQLSQTQAAQPQIMGSHVGVLVVFGINIMQSQTGQQALVIATHSLAALLEKPALKAETWQHLCAAKAHVQSLQLSK